jgi:hypothetical protein
MSIRWNEIPKANGHIHTPWSFSAFNNVEQALKMAAEENIKALGINDFNTFDGYAEFDSLSRKYKVYPMFNVEFMGLMEDEQKTGFALMILQTPEGYISVVKVLIFRFAFPAIRQHNLPKPLTKVICKQRPCSRRLLLICNQLTLIFHWIMRVL